MQRKAASSGEWDCNVFDWNAERKKKICANPVKKSWVVCMCFNVTRLKISLTSEKKQQNHYTAKNREAKIQKNKHRNISIQSTYT